MPKKIFDKNQSRKEAEKNGKKGGIESGKIRRRKRTLREIADLILSKKITPRTIEILSKFYPDEKPEQITNDMAMVMRQVEKAIRKGDTRAYEVLQATVGEKPVDKVINLNADLELDEQDEEMLKEVAKKQFSLKE